MTGVYSPLHDMHVGWLRCRCGHQTLIADTGPCWGVTPPCQSCGQEIAAPGDHQIDPSQSIIQSGVNWVNRASMPPSEAKQRMLGTITIDPIQGVQQTTITVWVNHGEYVQVVFPLLGGYEALIRYLLRHWHVWQNEMASQHYCEIESWFLAADWIGSHSQSKWDPRRPYPRLVAEVTSAMSNFILLDPKKRGWFMPALQGVERKNPLGDMPCKPDVYNTQVYDPTPMGLLCLSLLSFECTEDYMRERWTRATMARWWRPGLCQSRSEFTASDFGGWVPPIGLTSDDWVNAFREYRTWHPGRVPNPRRKPHPVWIRLSFDAVRTFTPGRITFDTADRVSFTQSSPAGQQLLQDIIPCQSSVPWEPDCGLPVYEALNS